MTEERVQLSGTYESMYQRAELLFRSGDVDEGVELLQRILKRLGTLSEDTLRRHEDLAQFGYEVGMELVNILAARDRTDEAVQVLQSLCRFSPEEADAIERRTALVLAAKGDLDEALAIQSSLTERFPYDPYHWLTLAELRAMGEDYAQADADLDKAEELATEPAIQGPIYYWRFIFKSQQGQKDKALEAWDRMAELRPELAQRMARRLYTYLLDIGDLELLRHYLSRDAYDIRADYYRGVIDNREGDFTAGLARWRKLLERNPFETDQGRLEWAEAALRTGRTKEAVAALSTPSEEARSPHAHLLLAIGMARLGEIEDARRVLEAGARLLRSEIPRRTRYTATDWETLTSLTDNREVLPTLKEFFEVEEAKAQ